LNQGIGSIEETELGASELVPDDRNWNLRIDDLEEADLAECKG
jgi:hypothetical protein